MEHICYEEFYNENKEQDFWSIDKSIWTDSEFFTALICKINNSKVNASEIISYFSVIRRIILTFKNYFKLSYFS
ncbi:hypothetical protein [Romboutsia sp.]|uniref:hypothetical protein n=1 Tax=Romboutsia sp. TaxID=1965302 RepID=UPI003F2C0E86